MQDAAETGETVLRQESGERRTEWNLVYALQRKKIKNLNLRVRGDGRVLVSAPMKMPLAVIEAFLWEKREWIQRARQKALERRRKPAFTPEEEKRLREEAQTLFPQVLERVFPLLAPWKIPYPQWKVRKMKSRWGSCLPQKAVIHLNVFLAAAPVECVEYVVLHELCHMVEANHSPAFYDLLNLLMPDWRRRRTRLREEEGRLPE